MNLWVILPVVGALLGWGTNRLALWMLFHPQRPVRLFGWPWQGVIPGRRSMLAESLSQALEEHLLTPEDRQALLDKLEIERHLDRIVTQTLQNQIPRGPFQKVPALEGAREKLIDVLRSQILQRLPGKLSEIDERILVEVAADIDVAGHVRQRLLDLPMDQIEILVKNVARRELIMIELAGAVIGFFVGLLQAAALALFDELAV